MTILQEMLRFDQQCVREIGARVDAQPAGPLAGVDEAGRGPLAGPVVAAVVVLPRDPQLSGLRDSKLLTPAQRARLFDAIIDQAEAVAVGSISSDVIDEINILRASLSAMAKAVSRLRAPPGLLLVDGNQRVPRIEAPQRSIVKGDQRSACIAAASIIAKVSRDRIMQSLDRRYPGYGFARHKGYPTVQHREAIRRLGPCRVHRRTFRGVAEVVARRSER